MTTSHTYPQPADDAPVVVFDFDHTLYDGDSGSHFFAWMVRRNWLRTVLALLATPVLGPLIAMLPTRRCAISGYIWIATIGLKNKSNVDALIAQYVQVDQANMRKRLLPIALDVFAKHREAGDRVVVATGAPPELARRILSFAGHQDVPVLGTLIGPRYGAMGVIRHCHHEEKMRMLREQGYGDIEAAYSDSSADMPLLKAARKPVVVNPRPSREKLFRQVLPKGTPILNWGCVGRGGKPVRA